MRWVSLEKKREREKVEGRGWEGSGSNSWAERGEEETCAERGRKEGKPTEFLDTDDTQPDHLQTSSPRPHEKRIFHD